MFRTLRNLSTGEKYSRSGTLFFISALVLIIAAVSSAFLGVVYISPIEVTKIFLSQIPYLGDRKSVV